MKLDETVKNGTYFHRLISEGMFRFDRLNISGIDNEPVFKLNVPEIIEQETCLFHRDIANGDAYLDLLHSAVERSIAGKRSIPIVRFADGEYAFYRYSLACNGLYQQAVNVEAIKAVMPSHIKAMKINARVGKIAPLVFPGNIQKKERGFFSLLRKSKNDDSAIRFLEFLNAQRIELNGDNYLPFYALYAYQTSGRFARLLDGKSVCVINAEYNEQAFRKWFGVFSSRPRLSHAAIPESYVATQWPAMKEQVLSSIPEDANLCLVGAGVGALLVCVDIAEKFSIPAIDAGHVLNMMNGREDKSKGPRLYTIWK